MMSITKLQGVFEDWSVKLTNNNRIVWEGRRVPSSKKFRKFWERKVIEREMTFVKKAWEEGLINALPHNSNVVIESRKDSPVIWGH